jgi:capsular exopolysaccharide synthesis family protein
MSSFANKDNTLIVENNPKSPVSEAYRTLRTSIQFSSVDKKMQSILITSSSPGEGKSTVAANLALAMAEGGKKTILIDCDMRKPTIHKKFRISDINGLSNLLLQDLSVEQSASKYTENLYVLPSGVIPPNPSEILSSLKMKSFLEGLKNSFDYIIIDSPPIITVTDALILSTMVDGCLMVVAPGEEDRAEAQKAKELLLNVNANILGAVLNKIDLKSKKGYGYYYYYGSGGRKERRKNKKYNLNFSLR